MKRNENELLNEEEYCRSWTFLFKSLREEAIALLFFSISVSLLILIINLFFGIDFIDLRITLIAIILDIILIIFVYKRKKWAILVHYYI